jgi:hypothetical protein
VFPVRYELNSYIVFRKRLVSKRLTSLHCYSLLVTIHWKQDSRADWNSYNDYLYKNCASFSNMRVSKKCFITISRGLIFVLSMQSLHQNIRIKSWNNHLFSYPHILFVLLHHDTWHVLHPCKALFWLKYIN